MKYQVEHLDQLAHSQNLLSELFVFIAEHHDQSAYLTTNPEMFFKLWAGQDLNLKLKVFTARDDEGKIQGCVMALLINNPLFIAKPFTQRIVDLTQNDKAFADYVQVILASL